MAEYTIYRSQYTAEQIENAIGKGPIVDGDTGNWKVWDVSAGAYVDTGIHAKGDKGDKGDTGNTGPMGTTAYQAAVAGGYTGTESDFNAELAAAAAGSIIVDGQTRYRMIWTVENEHAVLEMAEIT